METRVLHFGTKDYISPGKSLFKSGSNVVSASAWSESHLHELRIDFYYIDIDPAAWSRASVDVEPGTKLHSILEEHVGRDWDDIISTKYSSPGLYRALQVLARPREAYRGVSPVTRTSPPPEDEQKGSEDATKDPMVTSSSPDDGHMDSDEASEGPKTPPKARSASYSSPSSSEMTYEAQQLSPLSISDNQTSSISIPVDAPLHKRKASAALSDTTQRRELPRPQQSPATTGSGRPKRSTANPNPVHDPPSSGSKKQSSSQGSDPTVRDEEPMFRDPLHGLAQRLAQDKDESYVEAAMMFNASIIESAIEEVVDGLKPQVLMKTSRSNNKRLEIDGVTVKANPDCTLRIEFFHHGDDLFQHYRSHIAGECKRAVHQLNKHRVLAQEVGEMLWMANKCITRHDALNELKKKRYDELEVPEEEREIEVRNEFKVYMVSWHHLECYFTMMEVTRDYLKSMRVETKGLKRCARLQVSRSDSFNLRDSEERLQVSVIWTQLLLESLAATSRDSAAAVKGIVQLR